MGERGKRHLKLVPDVESDCGRVRACDECVIVERFLDLRGIVMAIAVLVRDARPLLDD